MSALARAAAVLHVRAFRALHGRFVSRGPGGVRLLLLTTTGRRSGRLRTVPVGYVRHGPDLLISPGSVSAPAPGWLHNLRAHPHGQVELGDEHLSAHADEPGPPEHERLWRAMVTARPIYRIAERSKRGRERRIPAVIRLRVDPSATDPTP